MQTVEKSILSKARITARHTDDIHDVHRHKDRVDADERDPEVDLSNRFVHEAAKHLREPEVERRKHSENRSHTHHEGEVSWNDVGVVHWQIERALSENQTGDATGDEQRHESDRE